MKRLCPLALLVAAACSARSGSGEEGSKPTALVKVARAEPGAIVERITLYGVAEAGASGKAVLTAPVESRVVRIAAPVGTPVAAGSVIAELSPSPTASLDATKASADARAADLAYARARRMRADGLVSNADVETARAAAASADATLASLNARARGLTVRAPIAGFVDAVAVNPGDLLQPGAQIASVSRTGDLRAKFGAEPSVARLIAPGRTITIQRANGPVGFAVPVQSVAPVSDPQTRLVPVFARLPASAGVAIGESLSGTVAAGDPTAGLVVPYAALLDDGGQPYVFVVAGGVAHRRDVATAASDNGQVAVSKGLRAGDLVVTEGVTALEDGMKVRPR